MNYDSNNPNTAGITIGLPNSSNKGFDIKAGIRELPKCSLQSK